MNNSFHTLQYDYEYVNNKKFNINKPIKTFQICNVNLRIATTIGDLEQGPWCICCG